MGEWANFESKWANRPFRAVAPTRKPGGMRDGGGLPLRGIAVPHGTSGSSPFGVSGIPRAHRGLPHSGCRGSQGHMRGFPIRMSGSPMRGTGVPHAVHRGYPSIIMRWVALPARVGGMSRGSPPWHQAGLEERGSRIPRRGKSPWCHGEPRCPTLPIRLPRVGIPATPRWGSHFAALPTPMGSMGEPAHTSAESSSSEGVRPMPRRSLSLLT